MNNVVTVWEAVTEMSLAFPSSEGVNSSIIEVYDQAPSKLPKMLDQKYLTLSRCSVSRWGRESVPSSFASRGGQYLMYYCLQPIATQITSDANPNIVDALLMLIPRMGQGVCLSVLWL